ncbi:TPA: hypothetical protein ACH3X1_005128 [Trebouxia sp. C0004]
MASPNFEPGRPTENANELARLIERGLRETKAVDLEALCVLAGRKVWSLRVDVHILDHNGNLADAASLSALAALLAFRRPEVTLEAGEVGEGQQVVVHPPDVREPLPLSIHHTPLCITFASFQAGELMVVDPNLEEEAAASGLMTVVMNAFGELCAVQKTSGIGLPATEVMRLIRLAEQKAKQLSEMLQASLKKHDVERVQARIRRHNQIPLAPQLQGRAVAILNSSDVIGGGARLRQQDSGTDDSDLVSTSESESESDDQEMEIEAEDQIENRDAADVEKVSTSGNVADNMAEGYKDSQSQLSSVTQHVTHAKANWRQARPPKAADVKQEQPDPDLQNRAAFIAGMGTDLNPTLEDAVKPAAQRNKRSKTGK